MPMIRRTLPPSTTIVEALKAAGHRWAKNAHTMPDGTYIAEVEALRDGDTDLAEPQLGDPDHGLAEPQFIERYVPARLREALTPEQASTRAHETRGAQEFANRAAEGVLYDSGAEAKAALGGPYLIRRTDGNDGAFAAGHRQLRHAARHADVQGTMIAEVDELFDGDEQIDRATFDTAFTDIKTHNDALS